MYSDREYKNITRQYTFTTQLPLPQGEKTPLLITNVYQPLPFIYNGRKQALAIRSPIYLVYA